MAGSKMTVLLESQAQLMASLQSRMNSKVDTLWIEKKFPYLRAVVIEAAEAIEHHGWKWWKKQACDLSQLQMEIIDIWHFLLSELLLQTADNHDETVRLLLLVNLEEPHSHILDFDGKCFALDSLTLVSKLELLIGLSVVRRLDLVLFKSLMLDCGLTWESLFEQYVSKNVLNFFRQDHGYKEGSYLKFWAGKEDNEHLVELMDQLDSSDPSYPESLYKSLATRYQQSQSEPAA
jgi:hypothetical protein